MGNQAGQTNQGTGSIAIGWNASQTQQGSYSITLGYNACGEPNGNQGGYGVSIGFQTAYYNQQDNAIAIGRSAAYTQQGASAIAIGYNAGFNSQGASAIAIGNAAGQTNQGANSIIINATGALLNNTVASSTVIKPLRTQTTQGSITNSLLFYNSTSGELVYAVANAANVQAKTFVIDHPTKKNNFLVHACLEGPEAGVYYRGRTYIEETSVVICLPDYVAQFAYDFTVSITAIGKPRLCSASEVESDGTFMIFGDPGNYHWVVYGKRHDIVVEPLKDSVSVQGSGPYRWIS